MNIRKKYKWEPIPRVNLSKQVSSSLFSQVETHDVFLQAWSLPGWTQNYTQLGKGGFYGTLSNLTLGPLQVFQEGIHNSVDQHGQPKPNSIVIGVPSSINGEGFWCGDKLEVDTVFFLSPNTELKFRTPLRSEIYAIALDIDFLRQYSECIEKTDIDRLTHLNGVVRPNSISTCRSLKNTLHQVFNGLKQNPASLNVDEIRQTLLNDIMDSLALCLGGVKEPPHHRTGQTVHRNIVENATNYILSNRHQPPTVMDISQELRISRRTLHYSFQKVLGVSPAAYLRYIRLHGARHELLSNCQEKCLISDVAAHWGFWHLGMFSHYYKALFGETPSVTLRRASDNPGSLFKITNH